MAAAAPIAGAPPRFEPALMRRKLTRHDLLRRLPGGHRRSSCWRSLLLLVDVLVAGLPWLDVDFLTGVAVAPAGPRGHPAGPRRIARDRRHRRDLHASRSASRPPIYLAEYARDTRLNRLLQTNISNLAGVPSIIYGILGLAVFVRLLELGSDGPGRRPDADAAHPAGRHHRLDRGAQGRPGRPARGRLRPRRVALADGPPVGPAGRRAGDHDRDHPGHGPGDRRGGAAHPHRGVHLRDLRAATRSRASSRSCRSRSSAGRSGRRTTSRASRPRRSSSSWS